MTKITAIIIVSVGVADGLNAQSISPDVVASAGTHDSNGTSQLSWTIGEPVISTHDNGSNTLTQGFHQTQLTVTGINETESDFTGVMVYPNPVDYHLNLRFDLDLSNSTALLYDAAGRLLLSEQIVSGTKLHQLDISGLANGSYILQLLADDGRKASFNIQKTQP